MKHEILKKTLLYRIISFCFTITMTTIFTLAFILLTKIKSLPISITVAIIIEIATIGLYYTFEYYWRKLVEYKRLKKGDSVLCINGDPKVRIAYEVIVKYSII